MAKSPQKSTRSVNGYQKYFDPKSLKNVASCAAIIFIIVHLIDYLWSYTIPLRILNFITLSLCLLITFLFVVNELGRLDEKIILGVANAALLFFSVIGFNSTITSNALVNTRNTADSETKLQHKLGNAHFPHEQYASFVPLFNIRNWMPPADLERKVDSLTKNTQLLRQVNQSQWDSLNRFRALTSNSASIISGDKWIEEYKECNLQKDSLQREVYHLRVDIDLLKSKKGQSVINPPISSNKSQDTSFMDKTNYISSYRTMKQKFEADLKHCQQEADEYRSKYNMLNRKAQGLMQGVLQNDH